MTNNEQLREIMRFRKLKAVDVAGLIGNSAESVRGWLVDPSSKRYRAMKDRDLEYLLMKLEEK